MHNTPRLPKRTRALKASSKTAKDDSSGTGIAPAWVSSPAAIASWLVCDLDAGIVRIEGAGCRESLSLREFRRSLHPADRPLFDAAVRAPEGAQAGTVFELRRRVPEGSERWLDLRELPGWRGSGSLVFALADATERKRREARLAHSQRLEALGELAGGVAHDLNNVLFSITGLVEYALESEEEAREDLLAGVLRAARRGQDLVRRLLSFARRSDSDPQVIDPGEVASDATRLLRPLLPAGVQLRCRFAEDLSPVRADEAALQQVVVNLVSNAAEALDEGRGTIEVHLENTRLGAEHPTACGLLPAGEYVRLTVRDDGRGIAPEHQARLFEPFFTTRAHEGGTGLGLAMVHGIVRGHGGGVEVESRPGEGTTFIVHWPVLPKARPSDPAPKLFQPPQGAARRVLLVDDDELVRGLLGRWLRRRGFEVLEAQSAEEALERLGQTEGFPDLLVLDQDLPGESGVALARELRARDCLAPALVLTGLPGPLVRRAARDLAGVRVLAKPISLGDLGRELATVLAAGSPPE